MGFVVWTVRATGSYQRSFDEAVAISQSPLDKRLLLSFISTIYSMHKIYALKWPGRLVREADMACDFEESFGTQKQAILKGLIPPMKTNC